MALHRDEEREAIEFAEQDEREHRFREDVPLTYACVDCNGTGRRTERLLVPVPCWVCDGTGVIR